MSDSTVAKKLMDDILSKISLILIPETKNSQAKLAITRNLTQSFKTTANVIVNSDAKFLCNFHHSKN
jgi:hypothetical protein